MLTLVGYTLGLCVIALFLGGTTIALKFVYKALKAEWKL